MTSNAPRRQTASGFTLVEMLTTMAIIAILIGLLVPAFGLIKNAAMTVRQQAQFQGISVALEAFYNDFGYYPPSNCYSYNTTSPEMRPDFQQAYSGAQKLAEAIVGWDSFGVHPRTGWWGDGKNDLDGDTVPEQVYSPSVGIMGSNPVQVIETAADNRTVRKGPYLEPESAKPLRLSDIYANLPTVGTYTLADSYVLADQFGKVANTRTGKKTGMPILYFRANSSNLEHAFPQAPPITGTKLAPLIYNVRDNYPFYQAAPPFARTSAHPLGQTEQIFYDRTTDPDLSGPLPRPRRSDYLLLSAGKDGLYGTADDVFNFETGQ